MSSYPFFSFFFYLSKRLSLGSVRNGKCALRVDSEFARLGQGATEYLVLLAVVLVIALVAIALLGFFPGMASDAQVTQSEMYWKSATPIAIVEWGAKPQTGQNRSFPYLRLINNGNYPLRITKLLGGDGQSISQWCNGSGLDISQYYYLAPGEEKYFGNSDPGFPGYFNLRENRRIYAVKTGTGTSSACYLYAASVICDPLGSTSPGFLNIKNFGFEYEVYIDGVAVTKRQIGAAPLMIRCT